MLQLWLLATITGGAAINGENSSPEEVAEPRYASDAEKLVPVIVVDGKNVAPNAARSHEAPRAYETGPADQYPSCATNYAYIIPEYFPTSNEGIQTGPSHRPDGHLSGPSREQVEFPTPFYEQVGYSIGTSYGYGGYPSTLSYGQMWYPNDPSYGQGGYPTAPSYGGYQTTYPPSQFYMPPYQYGAPMIYPAYHMMPDYRF